MAEPKTGDRRGKSLFESAAINQGSNQLVHRSRSVTRSEIVEEGMAKRMSLGFGPPDEGHDPLLVPGENSWIGRIQGMNHEKEPSQKVIAGGSQAGSQPHQIFTPYEGFVQVPPQTSLPDRKNGGEHPPRNHGG